MNPKFVAAYTHGDEVSTGLGCVGSLVQSFHFDSFEYVRVRCCFISISISDIFCWSIVPNADPCLWHPGFGVPIIGAAKNVPWQNP